MSKIKLFTENFLVYGLGGIISKIIPLIMVPIITRIMPNSDYFGISDMSNTIMSFAMYFAILGMYDAMYRLFFEKDDEEYKKSVCSTTFIFTVATSVIVFLIMIISRKWIAAFFFDNAKYVYVVYITAIATLVGATNSIISAPTRMQNKRKVFLITNSLGPIISYSVSIPLLLKGYYVIALPLAGCISGLIMEISFGIMNRKWFSIKKIEVSLLKPLLKIGLPLFPNFLVYWVFNSCDRVMITRILGIGESGKYAVGSKLGLASQLIYTAFAGGWQYFAFSTMKDENQVESNSRIFEYLGCISFVATMFVCAFAKPIYDFLFTSEYDGAFIISPYLFLAPLLLMLFQVGANQFLVIKDTWPNLFILAIGAIANIFINRLLIPSIGIEGAAIATLVGYIISVIICSLVLVKMHLMSISKKFIFTSIYMLIAFLLWRLVAYNSFLVSLAIALVLSLMVCGTYIEDIIIFINKMKNKQ